MNNPRPYDAAAELEASRHSALHQSGRSVPLPSSVKVLETVRDPQYLKQRGLTMSWSQVSAHHFDISDAFLDSDEAQQAIATKYLNDDHAMDRYRRAFIGGAFIRTCQSLVRSAQAHGLDVARATYIIRFDTRHLRSVCLVSNQYGTIHMENLGELWYYPDLYWQINRGIRAAWFWFEGYHQAPYHMQNLWDVYQVRLEGTCWLPVEVNDTSVDMIIRNITQIYFARRGLPYIVLPEHYPFLGMPPWFMLLNNREQRALAGFVRRRPHTPQGWLHLVNALPPEWLRGISSRAELLAGGYMIEDFQFGRDWKAFAATMSDEWERVSAGTLDGFTIFNRTSLAKNGSTAQLSVMDERRDEIKVLTSMCQILGSDAQLWSLFTGCAFHDEVIERHNVLSGQRRIAEERVAFVRRDIL